VSLGGFRGGLGGGMGRGIPGSRYEAGEVAARSGRGRRAGLGLGTTAPSPLSSLLRALRYLIPFRRWLIVYALCWLIGMGFDNCVPLAVRWAIDRGIVGRDGHALAVAAATAGGLSLAKIFFIFLSVYLFHFYEAAMARDLRDDLYRRLQSLSYRTLDRVDTGQLIARSTADVDALQNFMGHGINGLLTSLGTYIYVLAFAWHLSWQLTLLSTVTVPALLWSSIAFGRSVRPIYIAFQQAYGRLTGTLEEYLSGVRVIKAFAREPEQRVLFGEATEDLMRRSNELGRLTSIRGPLLECIALTGSIVVVWYGGMMAIHGTLTVGTIIAFNYYLARLVGPTRRLGMIVAQISRALGSAQRIFEIIDAPPDVQDRPGARPLESPRGEVRFEDVSFGYESGKQVLQHISLVAHPGQVIGIVGETGSGKSSLVNLIPRFYDVTSGTVRIDGHDVRDLTVESLRAAISLAPQDVFLFNESVRDNIAYGRPGADMEAVQKAAGHAQAHRFVAGLPEGYDTEVGDRGSRLSGGQRQRASLARALLPEPRILILDDTTSSVDTETERQIESALRRVMAGRTTFLVSHRVSSVRRADEILVLERGRIVERGTHTELVDHGGIYARMVAVQTGEAPLHV
jgi:ABC-type multidrug transport system fused ATPase/permease subunit